MTVPARSPVDDALDLIESYFNLDFPRGTGKAALATVREALEQLREERDAARKSSASFEQAALVASAEADAAEAEVARLSSLLESTREGLRERDAVVQQMLDHMEFAYYPQAGDGPHLADPFDLMDAARALLAASPGSGDPSDGSGGGWAKRELDHSAAEIQKPIRSMLPDGGGA